MNSAFRNFASAIAGTMRALLVASLALPFGMSPAAAQFTDQSVWVPVPGGTVNAITLAVANWSSNKSGVCINFLPTGDNSSSVTANVSSVSTLAVLKPSNAGLTALSGGELRSGQWATICYDGTRFVLANQLGKPILANSLANSAFGFDPVNLQINATVGSNQLTVAIKGNDGNDPSATNPVLIPFRSATISSGAPSIVAMVAAKSFTINSTNTMGCVSAQMCRLWVVMINNSGTAEVCLFNALSGANIAPINEAVLQTSAVGTSGGSLAQTFYCSASSVSSKAIKIVGYVEVQEVTAGTWATGPTYVQLFGPGIKRPGEVMQSLFNPTGANTQTSNVFSATSTAPTTATGALAVSQPITPTSAANVLRITARANVGTNTTGGANQFIYLIGPGSSTAIASTSASSSAINTPSSMSLLYQIVANSTSTLTYSLYFSGSQPGGINGNNGGGFFGGTGNTNILVEEFQG